MKRLISFSFLCLLVAGQAFAASPTVNQTAAIVDPYTPSQQAGVSKGGGLDQVGTAATSTGYQQLTSLSSAAGVSVPAGSTYCIAIAEGGSVRYRGDGSAPTATIGVPMAVGQPFSFRLLSFTSLQFIQVSATASVDFDCYKD